MVGEDDSASVELEELLQFLYMCPIGLVDFDHAGAVHHINPEAVNQLAIHLGVSAFTNVYAMFETWWPELRGVVQRDRRVAGRLIDDHRITGTTADGRWGLGLWVARVASGRNMLAVVDLSQAVEHEAHVHDDLVRFQAMANELPVVLWVQDEQGNQQWVNDTFCSYFGVTRAEMQADRWRMLVHPDDGPGYVDAYQEALRTQRPFHASTRVRDHQGRWRWLESWGRARFDRDGRFIGHLGRVRWSV